MGQRGEGTWMLLGNDWYDTSGANSAPRGAAASSSVAGEPGSRCAKCCNMRERPDSCGMDTPSSSFWFLPGGAGCCSCLCIPLRRQQRQQQQQQQQRHASPAQQPLATASPNSTAATSMVQMFYYENRGKCCKKLLQYNGYPNKVLLFPEEGWARSASSSYWTLTPAWWSRSRCKVVEVAGTRRYSTQAKMVDKGTGNLYIVGSFKRMSPDPDFKLYLTSDVSTSDFNMGYSMTGTLERGSKKNNSFQMTHFAVIRRRDYEKP